MRSQALTRACHYRLVTWVTVRQQHPQLRDPAGALGDKSAVCARSLLSRPFLSSRNTVKMQMGKALSSVKLWQLWRMGTIQGTGR